MRSLFVTIVLALLAGGCADSPQAKFYTLGVQAPQDPVQATGSLRIAIESVTVPDLVDRPQIVVRVDAAQVDINEFARWAEPLKSQVTRVLASDLSRAFPGALVSGYPTWSGETKAYRVSVDVQSFESALGDTAAIVAVWTVQPSDRGHPVSGRTVAREPTGGPGYDALVDAHSRALGVVSADITRAIRATQRP
ncbi:membrane integrity-associated transporter subunit PqiC [Bordetella flabilis]|uniref:ABC-type transport auxiliary lipoprotein component domain-containing protein n=1 Tax=Bordetella flabilis TaxID=463014 RepID=A0A193GAV0_9BORD|nr:PqiC family protein [Bordetella flabilis]ANN76404.1 hypothetical protein BAU07_04085 [Bordetella flabilis]